MLTRTEIWSIGEDAQLLGYAFPENGRWRAYGQRYIGDGFEFLDDFPIEVLALDRIREVMGSRYGGDNEDQLPVG